MNTLTRYCFKPLFVFLFFLSSPAAFAQVLFDGGLGTLSFPYEISTAAQLEQLAKYINAGHPAFIDKCYRLTANINLSTYSGSFNGGKGWIPIGHNAGYPFRGHFDGNNKIISNLYINHPSTSADAYDNTGLFGRIEGGAVVKLGVTGVNIAGNQNVGGIAGFIGSDGSKGSEITNCYVMGSVTGQGVHVGGVAGRAELSRITNCYATGSVTGKNYVGGIAGLTFDGSVRNCAALNERVSATDAGASMGRVSFLISYIAGSLSNNFAFWDMIKTANNIPVSVFNYANGEDGASRTGLALNAISGFPSGFNTSPWSFTAGRLPGLGGAVTKPQYLVAILTKLTVQRDGMAWSNHGKTFTLKLSTNESISFPMTGTGGAMETVVDRSGTWRIYDGATNTGSTITTNEVSGAGTINYFTVSFSVVTSGAASGSSISATYNGSAIASGATVLGGKSLVITATGAGASNYLYAWSGAGTNNQTTSSITIGFLDRRINAQCVVTSSHAVTFGVVNSNGTLTATVDGNAISSGALVAYGKSVAFTAKPNTNYRVKEWKNNTNPVNDDKLTYTAYNVTEALNVTVEYEFITHLVTFYAVNPVWGGITATVGGTAIASDTPVRQGQDVAFTANPQYGYSVKQWISGGSVVANNKTNSYTLSGFVAPTTVTVEFEISTYAVNFSVVGGTNGNGALTATANGVAVGSNAKIDHGSKVVFKATPNANYCVKAWKNDGATVNGTDDTYTIESYTAEQTVTVEFELFTYPVVFGVEGGNGSLAATANNIAITSGQKQQHGKKLVFTATPNNGYRVLEWVINNVKSNGTSKTFEVDPLTEAYTVTVKYEQARYPVTFKVSDETATFGTVSATIDESGFTSGNEVSHGKSIAFTANPNEGYRVKEWLLNGTRVSTFGSYTLENLSDEAKVEVVFELTTYRVEFSVVGGVNGKLEATAGGIPIANSVTQQQHGKTLVFAATANANYRIKEWKHNGDVVNGTDETYTINNITAAHTVTVAFELVTYAVTFSVNGSNGALAAKVNGVDVASVAQVPHGGRIDFTATPNPGYRVKEWTNNIAPVSDKEPTYSVTGVTEEFTVTVAFEYVTFPVSFNVVNGNGTITATVDETGISDGDKVQRGKEIVFKANPSSGYRVKAWSLDPANKSNTCTLTNLTAATTVTVEFELVTYEIKFNIVPVGSVGGALTASSGATGATAQHGGTVTFTATPSGNYQIKEWTDNELVVNGTNKTFTISDLSETHTVTVEFELIPYAVTFEVVNGNGDLTATANGTPVTSVAQVANGSRLVFTATPNSGFRVKGWTPANGTNTEYTHTSLTAALTVTVEFERITHVVNFSAGSNGTIAATVDGVAILTGAQVANNKSVVFTATPASGYRVKGWNLDPTNKTDTYTLRNPSATATVAVEFEPDTFTVGFSRTGTTVSGGSLSATVGGDAINTNAAVLRGKSVVFTATLPNNCTQVKEWRLNGAVAGDKSTNYTLSNLSANATVTVEFETAPCSVVTFSAGSNGTIAATVEGAVVTTGTSVPNGKSVDFKATPNDGYRVKAWNLNGFAVSGNTGSDYTLGALSAAATVTVEFEALPPTHHLVSFSVAGGGGGTLTATADGVPINSGASVAVGQKVVFKASPSAGYHIKGWTPANGNNPDYTINNLSASQNVTVEFAINTYTVNFDKVNEFGTLTATVEGSAIATRDKVEHGKNVVFSVVPNTGYCVKEWKLGTGIVGDKSNRYTLNNISDDATVTVEFELMTYASKYGVKGGNGSLAATADKAGIAANVQVKHGQTVEYKATPNIGYSVKEWTDNTETVNGKNDVYTLDSFTVDHNVTVEFEPVFYSVTFFVNGGNGMLAARDDNAAITSDAQVQHGEKIVFTATPNSGYRVKEWKLGTGVVGDKSNSYTLTGLNDNITVTVEFERVTYSVSYSVFGANGTIAAAVNGSGISDGEPVREGRDIVFTASPANGYRVKEWKLGIQTVGDKSNDYTLTDLNANATVTVEFEKITVLLTYSVIGAPNGNGSLTSDAGSSNRLIDYGRKVVFSATAASGYRVREWKDNETTVNGDNEDYTINSFTLAHNVTVEFEPIPYRVSFNVNGGNGGLTANVDGSSINSGTRVPNTESVEFTATPNTGYCVKEWTRGGVKVADNTTNSYTLTGLNANTTVTVEFEIVTHEIIFSVEGGNGSLAATVDGSGISTDTSVQQGREIVFMASPITGFSVKEWKIDETIMSDYTAPNYTLTLEKPTKVTVAFEPTILKLTYRVNGGDGTLTATVDGDDIPSEGLVGHGKSVVLTAEAGPNYQIKEWKDNGVIVNGTNDQYTINDFSAAHTVLVEFELILFPVSFYSLNSNGSLTATVKGTPVNSDDLIPIGSEVVFTAKPDARYRITGWTDNDNPKSGVADETEGTEIYTINNLTAEHTVIVDFEQITYPVTFSAGSNGSLAATVDDNSIMNNTEVPQGKEIVFLASPDNGYSVSEWKRGGAVIQGYKAERYPLPGLSKAEEVTVTFELTILRLTYRVDAGSGKITATYEDDTPITSGNLVDYAKNVILKATPESGYQIKGWKDNGETVNGDNPTYTIPNFVSEHIVLVEFEPLAYPVTFGVVNGNGELSATVEDNSITSIAQVEHSKKIVFEAEPAEGYRVMEWIYNGVIVADNTSNIFELPGLSSFATVTVEFEPAFYEVKFGVPNGNGTLEAKVGNMVSIDTGDEVPHGRNIVFMATPSDGYRIKEWRLFDAIVTDNITDNNYVLTLTAMVEVTVEFEMITTTILTSDLPDGTVGISYKEAIPVMSYEPVIWSVESGNLPDGLNLSDIGEIEGIPEKAGTFIFTVKAEGNSGIDTKQLTCVIEKGAGLSAPVPVALVTTFNSITVNTIAVRPNGQIVEYAINTTDLANPATLSWQDDPTFNNLTANITYYVYARTKGNDDYHEGEASVSVAIVIEEKTTGSGEDIQANPLKAYVQGGQLHVRELTEGKVWSVFSASGMLVYRGVATSDEMVVSLSALGVFIIQSEDRTLKVSNHGQ